VTSSHGFAFRPAGARQAPSLTTFSHGPMLVLHVRRTSGAHGGHASDEARCGPCKVCTSCFTTAPGTGLCRRTHPGYAEDSRQISTSSLLRYRPLLDRIDSVRGDARVRGDAHDDQPTTQMR